MSPRKGTTHSAARSDSGAARLWAWARRKRRAWTADEAAAAADIHPNRCRATVKALKDAGLLVEVEARKSLGRGAGSTKPTYRLTPEAEAIDTAPILTMRNGAIIGVRFPEA